MYRNIMRTSILNNIRHVLYLYTDAGDTYSIKRFYSYIILYLNSIVINGNKKTENIVCNN